MAIDKRGRTVTAAPCERYVRGGEASAAPVSFAPDIETDHWRFDPAQHDDIYVVGDVHGCLDELKRLWGRLDPSGGDLVIFVGDLVRKGPASNDVVEFVARNEHAVSVRGNNEAKIIYDRIDTEPFEPVRDLVESFPLVVSWGDSMAVHGGIDPRRQVEAHDRDDLLEMRAVPPENGYDGPFWFEIHDETPQVFFGHTVLDSPYLSEAAVGLDTGCVYGGELTAYHWQTDETISVPARETYESRSDDKILSF